MRAELRLAWRELGAARRRHDELSSDAAAEESRLARCAPSWRTRTAWTEDAEGSLRAERERLRHVTELAEAAGRAVAAIAPDEGEGASALVGGAERCSRRGRPGSRRSSRWRRVSCGTPSSDSARRRWSCGVLESLQAEPDRLEQVESELERIAEAKRRFRCADLPELLGAPPKRALNWPRSRRRRSVAGGGRCARGGREAHREASRAAREEPARRRGPVRDRGRAELQGVGLGEGEFRAELGEREPGATGADEVVFLIRANPGLPFAPVAETASGGELSRIALAIAAVGGRRDDGVRRDRRRDRRRDGARGRRDAAAPGRARTGDHDHAPAADRDRC